MSSVGLKLWRACLISLSVLLTLVLLLLSVASLALITETASRQVVQLLLDKVNALDGMVLENGNISGNLLRGLTISDMAIDFPAARVSATSVRAEWNPYSLLSGSFYVSELEIAGLRIELPASRETDAALSDPLSLLRIQPLPVSIAVGSLSASDITLVMPEQEMQIEKLSLGGELNGVDLGVDELRLEAFNAIVNLSAQASLQGDIPMLASVNWEYQGTLFSDYNLAVGSAAITGDLKNLIIEHELLAPESIHSSGSVFSPLLASELSLQFTHSIDTLRLPFPEAADYLFGNLSLVTDWEDGELALRLQGDVRGPLLPESTLTASGTLVDTSLHLTTASLQTATGILSASGQTELTAPFASSYRFDVNAMDPLQYFAAALPDAITEAIALTDVAANGNVSISMVDNEPNIRLVIDAFRGITNGYELTGAAAVGAIGTAVQIEELRLNTIANEILLSGEYQDEIHLNWHLTVPELQQLLSGTSGAAFGSGQIDGAPDNPAISASLRVENLQSGAVSAGNMTLEMTGTRQQLRADVRLQDILFASGAQEPGINLAALQINGSVESHNLNIEIDSSLGTASIVASGGFSDFANLRWEGVINAANLDSGIGNWEKQQPATALVLARDTIDVANSCWELAPSLLCFDLQESTPRALGISATLDNFALADLYANRAFSDYLPRSLADTQLSQRLALDGMVSATLAGTISMDGAPPLLEFGVVAHDAVLQIAGAEIIDEALADELIDLEDQHYNWDTLSLNGRLENRNWNLSASAVLSEQNLANANSGFNGMLDSTLSISTNGDLAGTVTARFAELGWIEAFVPEASAVSGSLAGQLDISGSLQAPRLAGAVSLQNGTATIPRLGITWSGMQSQIAVQNSGSVQIDGEVGSSSGTLTFKGEIANLFANTPGLRATLSGNNFQLADIADLNLQVSPDITLEMDRELVQINGSLDVPVLDLTLLQLPATAVDVSRDAVVVNYPSNRPDLENSFAATGNLLFDIPVAAEINLTLGDAVTVSGFGMQATLDGDLDIQQRGDGRILAYGELGITEGNYRIYGQTLNLRQGKMLFFGAIDNPALDVRAVREDENLTVGVLMNGTLKNIRSQLFSTPVLPDNDIIAVLVTGRPAAELGEQDGAAVLGAIANLGLERGQGLTDQIRNTLGIDALGINNSGNLNTSMLTIGKYLTPDIFVRYGVGLFDKQSKVAIDYSLSDRVILQAESGEYQNIDITYKVER